MALNVDPRHGSRTPLQHHSPTTSAGESRGCGLVVGVVGSRFKMALTWSQFRQLCAAFSIDGAWAPDIKKKKKKKIDNNYDLLKRENPAFSFLSFPSPLILFVTGIRLKSGAREETGRFRDVKRCVATEDRTRVSGIHHMP